MGLFIALVLMTAAVGFILLMALAASGGSKESKNPDAALDAAFSDGGDIATWQLTMGGLSERQVVAGAAERGYRPVSAAGRSGLITFERRD